MIKLPVAWILLAVVCLAARPAAAESQEYAETIDVDVVNVEVVVTDRDGQPVTGLTRDDFEVFENSEKIELTNFYAATPPQRTGEEGSPAAAPLPADGTQVLNLVILVDQLNIAPQNRAVLFDQLRDQLPRHLGERSRVMVAVMGSRFEVPVQFTEDLAPVFSVLDAEEKKSSKLTGFDVERRVYFTNVQRASLSEYSPRLEVDVIDPVTGNRNRLESDGDYQFDGAVATAMELAITGRTLAAARTQRTRATVQALGELCDQLGRVPGRKALLYLSDGLPQRPGEPLLEAWAEKFETWAVQNEGDIRAKSRMPEAVEEFRRLMSSFGSRSFDLGKDLDRLAIRASDSRVAFYPISASGRDHSAVAAGERGSGTGAPRAAAVAESFTREASLIQLAEDTGGVAMLRSSNLGHLLARVRRDFESFYSLGYSPLHADDRFRRLRIEVRRDGVTVHHVKGYRNARPALAEEPRVTTAGFGEVTVAPGPTGVSEAAVSEVIDVRVVNLEVVVTDRSGQPLPGLTLADFEVYEDGRRMELTNFYRVERAPDASAPAASAGDLPAATSAVPAGDVQGLHLVIYVDNLNIQPRSRKLLFESLRRYLREHHGSPIMLVTMNRRVEVALPFTRDVDQILATLDAIERGGSRHLLAEGRRRMLLSRLERASLRRYDPSPGVEGDPEFDHAVTVAMELSENVRSLAEERYQKVEATLEALGGLCDALGGLAGRKALVYLSDGLPLRPADSLIEAWQGKYEAWLSDSEDDIRQRSRFPAAAEHMKRLMNAIGSPQLDLQSELNRLTLRASDNRVALYPISSSGRSTSVVSSERMGYQGLQASGTRLGAMATESLTRDGSLMRMAADTGGVAVLRNANLGRLLEQVESDFSSFYSLGYTPPIDREAVGFHRLAVKVSQPGAEVRHVKGYRDKGWRQRLGEMTTAAALFAVESNPLGVQVTPGEVTPEGEGFRLPLTVKIPFRQMRLVHRDKHFNAQLTLLVIVRNQDDAVSATQRIDLPISIPESRVLEVLPQLAACPVELRVPKGSRILAVGVRDHLAQVESTVMTELVMEGEPAG